MFNIYKVAGNSMEPSFPAGQYILTEKFTYLFKNPAVGDLVIAESPVDGRKLLKRITAFQENSYWLLGDNGKFSTDSRNFGLVSKEFLLAKVLL